MLGPGPLRSALQVLEALVHFKLLQQALRDPLAALAALADPPAAAPPPQQQQPPQLAAAAAAAQAGAGVAAAAAAAPGAPRLATLTPSGLLDWGEALTPALGVLLGAHWAPLQCTVSHARVQEELAEGSLHRDSLPGLPVALYLPRDQLLPAGAAGRGGPAAVAGSGDASPDPYQEEPGPPAQLLVAGLVVELSGKRLRTAFDFSQEGPGGGGSGCPGGPAGQRPDMALVRVPRLPPAEAGSGSGAAGPAGGGRGPGAEPLASPGYVELHCSCADMWRITGPLEAVLRSSGGGGGGGGAWEAPGGRQQAQQGQGQGDEAGPGARRAAPAAPREASLHTVWGYASAAGWLLPGSGGGGGEASVLLCVRLQHLELLVLAALSGDPALLAAVSRAQQAQRGPSTSTSGSPGSAGGSCADPYAHLSDIWATAAGQVAAGGSADGQRLGVLLTAGAARAVAHALVHGWSPRQLGEELGCDKAAAAALVASFLAAFPGLGGWWEAAPAEAARRGGAATLGGRQRPFHLAPKLDAMVSGTYIVFGCVHVLLGERAATQGRCGRHLPPVRGATGISCWYFRVVSTRSA